MKMLNQVKITFAGRSVNEGFARAALAAFLVQPLLAYLIVDFISLLRQIRSIRLSLI